MRSVAVILILLQFFTPFTAGAVSSMAPCVPRFQALRHSVRYLWNRLVEGDPNRLTDAEYDLVADTKVSFYFPDGKVTPERKARFYADFDLLIANYERRHHTKLANLKELKKLWEASRDDLLAVGLAEALKDRPLEQLLVETDRRHIHNPDHVPIGRRLVAPSNLLIPFRAVWGAARYLGHAFRNGWEVQLTGVLLGGVIGLFAGPVGQTLLRVVNAHLGFLAVKEQDFLAKLDARLSSHVEKVAGEEKKVSSAYAKYRQGEISQQEFDAIWQEAVETELEYKNAMNSWVSDNLKDGRNLYREGALLMPLQFIEAATISHTEILQYQAAIRDLETRLEDDERGTRPLSWQQKAQLQKELKQDREGLYAAEGRMGTVLAMEKVNEILYPEYNRSEFQKRYPGQARLMNSYEKFMKGLAFDKYYDAYRTQMDEALSDVGIHLQHGTKPEAPSAAPAIAQPAR